jgi:hypothetical protein
LAQEPRLLLLDEPTNHLDPRARGELLGLVAGLGLTVAAVLHDLALVPGFATKVAVMNAGRLVAFGTPEETLSPEIVREVFRGRRLAPASPSRKAATHRLRHSPIKPTEPFRMKRLSLLLIASIWALPSLAFPVTVDNCGKPLTFENAPQRAVIHDLNMAEMAFALDLQPSVVGLTGITGWYKVGPEFKQAQGSIPELAPKNPSIENIVSVEPDFLFAGWNYGLRQENGVTPGHAGAARDQNAGADGKLCDAGQEPAAGLDGSALRRHA